MKNTLIILLLFWSLALSGATYYVSPSGNDSNAGTIGQPWLTINKAWSVMSAGDIVYMRGGTYNYASISSFTTLNGKSGSSGNYCNIWAYPGERPVIDYSSGSYGTQKFGISMSNSSYVYLKGITITHLNMVTANNHYGLICWNNVTNCIFEQMEVSWIGGMGFTLGDDCANNLFLNCDAHHCADPYSSEPWGGSNGFECGGNAGSTNNTYRGCRSWGNADDGFDFRVANGHFTFENCWSFWNGYQPYTMTQNFGQVGSWGVAGDGVGFKMASGSVVHTDLIRTVKNCLSFENRVEGFTGNPTGSNWGTHEVYNSVSYHNGSDGFSFQYGAVATLRNNITYLDGSPTNFYGNEANVHDDHNSWNGGMTANSADFASLNSAGMDGPRQADGSLPNLTFLHLASGSKLIDAGVNVGISYSGNSPDLGAFEGGSGTTITVPVYTSGTVQNATPSLLEMTYNLTLANIVPVASAFSVKVNSVARLVSSVVISGTKVQLTLASPVVTGDIITVSYTIPASNPVQTTSGGQAATITAQAVTNNIIASNPVYVSSAIANATPTILEMTYNMTLANIAPAASTFNVIVNSVVRPVSSVVISGSKVQLTLMGAVVNGDLITVSYTKPTANQVQTTSGGQAATIIAQAVTNNIIASNPVYVSSAIANETPTILEMTYNMTLANSVPSISSFTVLINSVVRTVNSIAVSGAKVKLTLANRIVAGDVVTVSYTKPAANPIQTSSNGIAASISNQQVLNYCINSLPTAIITSPSTNSSFSASANITLTASALDTDGSVILVEFYNGTTKLGSKSSAPYTFTWNNVTAGNYSLTVTATDNLNAKSISSSISISVANALRDPNKHPIVKILNPRKGIKLEKLSPVTIDAIASDPDGTVSKVEFYNGSVKLVELTSAPYTFTWKDVLAGNYSIIAIATDNLNDTTVSSPVEFQVGSTVKYDVNSELIKLYPNPNNGHFSVEFINPLQNDKSEIIITDLAGKQVYRGPVLKEEKLKQIDVSGSRSGIYVMMIKEKEILVTKKFIKS